MYNLLERNDRGDKTHTQSNTIKQPIIFRLPMWSKLIVNTDYNLCLLLHGIMSGCIVMKDLVTSMNVCACITSDYPSHGIASFICVGCVGSTERARIDVSSKDIDSLLLSLFCTDSYSRRHIQDRKIYRLK
jgi:hypothetical protein